MSDNQVRGLKTNSLVIIADNRAIAGSKNQKKCHTRHMVFRPISFLIEMSFCQGEELQLSKLESDHISKK